MDRDMDAMTGGRGGTVDLRAELLVAARRGDDDPRPALDTAPVHSQTRYQVGVITQGGHVSGGTVAV